MGGFRVRMRERELRSWSKVSINLKQLLGLILVLDKHAVNLDELISFSEHPRGFGCALSLEQVSISTSVMNSTPSVPSTANSAVSFHVSELPNLLFEIRKHQAILASDHGRPDACYRISSRISRVALARAAHSVHV